MNQPQPTAFLRRSPLYRIHQQNGAEFVQWRDAALVSKYSAAASDLGQDEIEQAGSMAITDLTPLARTGFKGREAINWIESHGLMVPERANLACDGGKQTIIARLSQTECLLMESIQRPGSAIENIENNWHSNQPPHAYHLQRADSHGWFAVCGVNVAEMMSKVCAIDMRPHKFSNHAVAQTSVARLSAIVVRSDLASVPCYFILADLSACEFLWDSLLDAMQEFDGRPVGITALQGLATRDSKSK